VWHTGCLVRVTMNAIPNLSASVTPNLTVVAPGAERALGYHGAVCDFKRRLIEATLHQMRGNRTHAARALGLQRTYLLRLMRELRVAAPPPPPRGRAPVAR
jgi:DNA-binding NtrC family response regulator